MSLHEVGSRWNNRRVLTKKWRKNKWNAVKRQIIRIKNIDEKGEQSNKVALFLCPYFSEEDDASGVPGGGLEGRDLFWIGIQ